MGVAIVTGAVGGLGTAIVARLRADGLDVAAADIRPPADGFEVDVTDEASIEQLVRSVGARFGRIDVLVNNAGVAGTTAPVVEYALEDWRRVLDVNLTGVFLCTRAVLPQMMRQGYGRIVNVASIAGKEGNARMSAYSASKAGVIGFTKAVAKEVATTGILVNCVVPGVIDAGLTASAALEERRRFRSLVPMGRMGTAEEFAELVSWLASDRCSFSTGAAFDLSGGRATY
jgi:NAD(P)-dependent dehydrogenase (short-subunit alcohol dehydrogenase family)